MQYRTKKNTRIRHILSAPFILAPLLFVAVLDLVLESYHHVGFMLYRLERVKRSDYIKVDRHRLSYLNWVEKIGCLYCGYVNGWLNYAGEIAGRTEGYWCGIMHNKRKGFKAPAHHKNFAKYGNRKDLEKKYPKLN